MAHRVVIVGGGFAGLTAARALRRAPVDITLLDRRNFHCFQPLLYQVATGGLSPANIAAPLRGILQKQKNCRTLLADVSRIDPQQQVVHSDLGEHPYDSLLVCTGSSHAYFGHPEWEQFAPGLKTLEDAVAIRAKVFLAFEKAEAETDPKERQRLLTFVVIGAGPTGVELAGAIAELARHTLRGNFRAIDPKMARVILLEGGDRILTSYVPKLSQSALHSLQRLGVEVRLKAKVTHVSEQVVTFEQEGQTFELKAQVVLWGAGVQGSPLGKQLADQTHCKIDKQGRLLVRDNLTVPNFPNIFILGDLAHVEQQGKIIPGVAPVAMQMGKYAARLIDARLRNKIIPMFEYRDKGSMATIGRGAAVADLGFLQLTGYPAWLAWLFLHVIFLVGFESKLLVLIQWAWNYITRARSARLIADDPVAVRKNLT
ncbi:MAG: NAD(P)/FAD-dependent oxidoreductase [Planctomycetia bacterium]|nr:NAD(P)/FAD-dependent oxidoreductase [Planctomycetia bacterium]